MSNDNCQKVDVSRRKLLAGGAAAATTMMLGSEASASQINNAISWDKTFDVLVIGSGFAALSAAIEARRKGLDVMIVEKMRVPGGNSTINGGLFAVAGSELQKEEGVEDSVELMVQDMMAAGRGINHPELTRAIAAGSPDAFKFVVECGAKFKPKLSWLGGHSVARTYLTHNASGSGIVRPLVKTARREGVVIRTECKMLNFITNDDKRIIGIQVKDGYRFPDEETGIVKHFKARRGVVLASGGFSRDTKFLSAQDPRLGGVIDSTNQPGATGEALRAAFRIGAVPVQLSLIQLGPWASPDEQGFGVASMFNIQSGFRYGIMVKRATGKRFVNELADRKTRADAMIKNVKESGEPDYPIILVDSVGAKACPTLDRCLQYKVVHAFDRLEDLASHYQIPAEGLIESVTAYNEYVKNNDDLEFAKPVSTATPIIKPPFYAVRGWPKVHHCMGGVEINPSAQVLHSETFEPIAGLYAAGEVTGGPHGASRLGSCAITDGLVMGRIAGNSVARNDDI
ncbi:flavocytochrome c [Photobacterium alginatilyticum]|uniref:Flavocytochrome c n=1 Tax=Photobacterium alginatilyticum TaxID=1775171 RepID=A0ABW9YK76_9GAMM|nr:flavocytochrome c [Photobacterium alginatilyticum]NBI54247.1 flavocytochrome c [Photobacterium alginatilyticum]